VWHDAPVRRERFAEPLRAAFGGAALALVVCAVVVAGFGLVFGDLGALLAGPGFWIFFGLLAVIAVPAVFVEQLKGHGGTWRQLGRWLLRLRRAHPRGATPLPVPTVVHGRGRAAGDRRLVAPLSKRTCLAYAATLDDGDAVFLRRSETGAFRLEQDDGVIEIPAGPVDIVAGFAIARDASAWRATLVAEAAVPDPLPARRGHEITLVPGDVVEVLCELSTEVDSRDAASGYRDTPRVVRRPLGRPLLRQGQALPPKPR
jgi:hypothetical protein